MTQHFIEWNPVPEDQLNGKLESEAKALECRIGAHTQHESEGPGRSITHWPRCIASACAHWRWLHRGGMVHDKQTFQSEWPAPEGMGPPADVPDGWTFMHWDNSAKVIKAPKPRFWASRVTAEVVLPRGVCGLAHEP